MFSDALVKKHSGRRRNNSVSSLGKLERLLSQCFLQRKDSWNPQSLWSLQKQPSLAERQAIPGPTLAATGSSCPLAPAARALPLTSFSQQINSFTTKRRVAFFWLQTVGKRQQTGLSNYIAPCLLFYSENYMLFPLLICGHRDELLPGHFQCWPASAQYWWLPWQIISFCYAFKLSYNEFITSCDGDQLCCFKGFAQC